MISLFAFGQSYSTLWKKVEEAKEKDLPKTEYDVLQKIVKKAAKNKDYGHLLKAELQAAQAQAVIAPDSLLPSLKRIKARMVETSDPVARIVYQTVLYRLSRRDFDLMLDVDMPVLDEAICEKLAQVKDKSYAPIVVAEDYSSVFNHDLLSVVGYELGTYEPLYEYYKKVGNRRAACLTAAKAFWYASSELKSLMEEYADLQEAGELALAYNRSSSMKTGERLDFIHEALGKWGNWSRMDELRNIEQSLINPQFNVEYDHRVNRPMQPMTIKLEEMRNLTSVSLTVYRVDAKGDIDISPSYAKGYEAIKPLLSPSPTRIEKRLEPHQPYEFFKDSLTLEGLPVGVYMLEFASNPTSQVIRELYFVTEVYTLAESQPQGATRFAVVNATTGQPFSGAHLRIREFAGAGKYNEINVQTDDKGEYIYKNDKRLRTEVFAYTDEDDAAPELSGNNQYTYYQNNRTTQQTSIYTDRSIYRPGQTVHAAALVYDVADGYKHQATADKIVTFTLRDANWKEVKRIETATDEYGMCSADFTLPASALTGLFAIQANGQTYRFQVEEYKRPTFEVAFADVRQHYEAGDTVRVEGTARSYAGVPVQGATVKYTVERRLAFWWWSYWRYYDVGIVGRDQQSDQISKGEVITDDDGHFYVDMPLTMPKSDSPQFYNFVVTADVTDVAGETHSSTFSLPLGNRKTALSIDLKEKVLVEDHPTMTFRLRNAAGQDIDAEVKYRLDNGDWQTAKTSAQIQVCGSRSSNLSSGSHTVEAVYGDDTVKRSFVVFSIDDQQPATETDDWFWLSDTQFPSDGTPVTVQAGSSMSDVHIFYTIFSGDEVIESGTADKTNALINRKFTYEERYGDGLLLAFAWVKDSRCYTHTARISRPLPDKQLRLQWTTFRDRLTPGQQEEWTLSIVGPDGKPAQASLMATLYDKSLEQLRPHDWHFSPYVSIPLPNTDYRFPLWRSVRASAELQWKRLAENNLVLSHFDESVYMMSHFMSYHAYGGGRVLRSKAVAVGDMSIIEAEPAQMTMNAVATDAMMAADEAQESEEDLGAEPVQVRENLNETAFFYPQLVTDDKGLVALKFTLPESLTTWRFMGLAHTKDMCYGTLTDETVAQKDIMVQPNMPRFVREGDKAILTARIFNMSEKKVDGTAILRLIDPETDKVVVEQREKFSVAAGATTISAFHLQPSAFTQSLLICQVVATGKGFSDGEQHYLPILPASERVTVTVPFTLNEPGTKSVDLAALIPADGTNGKLTLEYTDDPAWLMIQALPTVGNPVDDNAISQTASYYANSIGQYLIGQNPKAKTVFELWKREAGSENSLTSALEKNQELKDILLGETPWVMDADRETEQKQRLADFFDDNLMQNRLSSALKKMKDLQKGDGSWSWWPGMHGSFYMTVAISEMLVRLNAMTGVKADTRSMLDDAFGYMGRDIVALVADMKADEKKGSKPVFPSFKALQWLYLCALDGRKLSAEVQSANNYLLSLLKKDIKNQSIYDKAMTAVILSETDTKLAKEYVQSLKEYTVYREDMGRYYDTPRAGYSWYDYKIPTQTIAIEAIQRLTPDDRQTILEMQRWLLQSKRTQAWDTPINSVNAVYAFLNGAQLKTGSDRLVAGSVKTDGKVLPLPEASAAIGYVKTALPDTKSKVLTVDKASEGTSWGTVYAQFTQSTSAIEDSGSGITVRREYCLPKSSGKALDAKETLHVGDRISVRITIEAERDLDFVQVTDKRAACLEPVKQLSGYHQGSYCTPRDNSTNFYFDLLSKGTHVIETEYFVDRPGTYETGTCTVQCAYAPEFRATTGSKTLKVEE